MSLAEDVSHSDVVYNISSLEPSASISFMLQNKDNKNNDDNNDNNNNKSKSLILKKNFTLAKLDFFTRDSKKIKD